MFVFRATQKVIKASGKIEIQPIEQDFDSDLSEWYVNSIPGGERGKFVMVFMHAATQTVIITTDKSLKKAFNSFKEKLHLLLERQYFKRDFIEKNFDLNADYIVTKTASRKILGQQNDAIKDVKYWMDNYTHFDGIKWSSIEDSLFKKIIWIENNEVSKPQILWANRGALMSTEEIDKERLSKS